MTNMASSSNQAMTSSSTQATASSASQVISSSNKRRRSRVSWMIQCSPYVTTSRGSSAKARRGLSRKKTDLDSMFDDIPQDGSPLSVQLLRDLKIEVPLFTSPTAPKEPKPSHEPGADDNICTNLMSLLTGETSGKDEVGEIEFDAGEQPPASKKRKVEILSPVKTRRQAPRSRWSQRISQAAGSLK